MIRNAVLEEAEEPILQEWVDTSNPGDKIRLRKYLAEGVTGMLAIMREETPVIESTQEYVIVLVRTEQLFGIDNAYPI